MPISEQNNDDYNFLMELKYEAQIHDEYMEEEGHFDDEDCFCDSNEYDED